MSTKEVIVARLDELGDGEMKQVTVDSVDVLLCKVDGSVTALGAHCPHYGAPLETGILSGHRIVCPWHHACFDARTGALLEPPSRDALASYPVRIDGDKVKIRLPENTEGSQTPKMATHSPDRDGRTYVIIGGGAAANAAAQAMREAEFRGQIIMLTAENRAPYDRPNLSKDYLQGQAEDEWMPLRDSAFYDKHDIEIRHEATVVKVDPASKSVHLRGGEKLNYDRLLIASGGEARQLDVPGAKLKNIFTLRSFDDADLIITACEQASQAVVIGASFIGMEVAHSLRVREIPVTVVAPESVPFERVFGKAVGRLFQKQHEKAGVDFKLGAGVKKFTGKQQVSAVELDSGERLDADLVIVGIGVRPATDFLQKLPRNDDGSLDVDDRFRVATDIYAAGDIARFDDWRTGGRVRIEHWRTAEQQGRVAGFNMAGRDVSFRGVPFFWSAQADLNFRYVGHAQSWDEEITLGDVDSGDFIVLYIKNGEVLAAAGHKRDKQMAIIEELMRRDLMPPVEEFHAADFSLQAYFDQRRTA